MKPTPTMFSRLRTGLVVAKPLPEAPPSGGGRPAEPPFASRSRELLKALDKAMNEEEKQQILGELEKLDAAQKRRGPVDDINAALKDAAFATPAPAMPGRLALRITGIDDEAGKIPLAGLRVRAKVGDAVIEGMSDAMGNALLHLDAKGSFDLEILAPGGEVVHHLTSRLAPGQSAPLEISIPQKPELEESFSRGRTWSQEIKRRAERLYAPPPDIRPLEERIAALEATVARLEQAISGLTQVEKKGEDHE